MNHQPPLVSIALCTYNGAQHVARQLDSLLEQDYPTLEIVITDDGSTDGTPEILRKYADQHSNIRLHHNETNLGFIKNFEKAISLCQGEFIALCDQDDIWFPHKISTLVSAIGTHTLAYSEVEVVDEDEQALGISYPSRKQLQGRCHMALLLTNFVIGHTTLFRSDLRDRITPIPESIVHDQWIAFVAASVGEGITKVDEPLSLYRFHDNNVIATLKRSKARKDKAERHRQLQQQLGQFSAVDGLPDADRQLIEDISAAHRQGEKRFFNFSLYRILSNHRDRVMAAYRKPRKAAYQLSKGLKYYQWLRK